jgi:hypothetical protein
MHTSLNQTYFDEFDYAIGEIDVPCEYMKLKKDEILPKSGSDSFVSAWPRAQLVNQFSDHPLVDAKWSQWKKE